MGPGELHHFGSKAYVGSMTPPQRRHLRGMVSLDRVGVGRVVPLSSVVPLLLPVIVALPVPWLVVGAAVVVGSPVDGPTVTPLELEALALTEVLMLEESPQAVVSASARVMQACGRRSEAATMRSMGPL